MISLVIVLSPKCEVIIQYLTIDQPLLLQFLYTFLILFSICLLMEEVCGCVVPCLCISSLTLEAEGYKAIDQFSLFLDDQTARVAHTAMLLLEEHRLGFPLLHDLR